MPLVLEPGVEGGCGKGSPVQAGGLLASHCGVQTAPSASICPDAISDTRGMRRGSNKNVHGCAAGAFPRAAFRSMCVFSLCFSSVGPFIYGLQLTQHKALGGSLGCLPKSSSMFWPRVCL